MQNSVANPAFKLKGKATATSPMRSVSEPGYEKGAAGGYLHPDAAGKTNLPNISEGLFYVCSLSHFFLFVWEEALAFIVTATCVGA